jgi:hypothetical protein
MIRMKNQIFNVLLLLTVLVSFSACKKDGDDVVSVRVYRIELLSYPSLAPNGGGWDLTSGPDAYLSIYAGTSPFWEMSDFFGTDMSGTQTYSVTPDPSLVFTNLDAALSFQLWDFDTPDPDDLMAEHAVILRSLITNLPSQIIIEGGGMRLRLSVTYTF